MNFPLFEEWTVSLVVWSFGQFSIRLFFQVKKESHSYSVSLLFIIIDWVHLISVTMKLIKMLKHHLLFAAVLDPPPGLARFFLRAKNTARKIGRSRREGNNENRVPLPSSPCRYRPRRWRTAEGHAWACSAWSAHATREELSSTRKCQ